MSPGVMAMGRFLLLALGGRATQNVSIFDPASTPPQPQTGDNAPIVTVVGRQWWWEYTYDHYNGRDLGVITANELHVPAGADDVPRPVYLTLKSADVCHSYWVPRLAGKTDLIPN